MSARSPYRYQPGGSLPATAPSYVVREADHELWHALQSQEYCYVLNARQMGKSSLRARTMQRLRAEGIATAEIELNGIGSQQITAQQWYGGIIWELINGFSLTIDRRQWLREHSGLSPIQRLKIFIETVLLRQISNRIVIFFDEIDSVLGLGFPTDEFFALIRYCYEQRANQKDYSRLSFVLLGVASPAELIQNKPQSTPFNIGRSIELKGFQLHEVSALIRGFESIASDPKALLKEVLYWTSGQPFLTQKLCWLLQQALDREPNPDGYPAFGYSAFGYSAFGYSAFGYPAFGYPALVADLVKQKIIHTWEAQDEPEHLRTIRDRILLRDASTRDRLLRLYRRICQQGRVKVGYSADDLTLKLSGIVSQVAGSWVIKNRIYQAVFDLDWIAQALPPEPVPAGQSAWITLGRSLVSAGLVMGLRMLGLVQPWELQTFDLLMRSRPAETADPRLFLITITEADVQSQPLSQRGAASLSDAALDQLRIKLEAGKPRVIGLDLYREQAVRPEFSQLADWMRSRDSFIGVCSYGNPGVPPPPEVSRENQGFNNVLEDSDGILRRYPLAVGQSPPCENHYSLSWLLAVRYLADEGIIPGTTPQGSLQLGETVFPPLEFNMGGYRQIDARGHQVMINPRMAHPIAETVSLGEFLSPQVRPEQVRDRIVLIGTSAPSFNDSRWLLPYRPRGQENSYIAGIEVQAHLVSQILSAILEQRSLIWSWPEPLEQLWILLWALWGGAITRIHPSRQVWWVTLGISGLVLVGSGWTMLLMGGWIPLLPGGLALLMASLSSRQGLRHSLQRLQLNRSEHEHRGPVSR